MTKRGRGQRRNRRLKNRSAPQSLLSELRDFYGNASADGKISSRVMGFGWLVVPMGVA